MSATLKEGAVVLVNRCSYLFRKPKIGDIVVLYNPDKNLKDERYIIKRVQKIKKIGDEELCFVVGDNEKESKDSRHFGWIKKDSILGKVIYVS